MPRMQGTPWAGKAINQAVKSHLSLDDLNILKKQLTELIQFAQDEKIAFFGHCQGWWYHYDTRKSFWTPGDLILTDERVFFIAHPTSLEKTGFISKRTIIHHDRYIAPISIRIGYTNIQYARLREVHQNYLTINYWYKYGDKTYDTTVSFWFDNTDDAVAMKVEIDNLIDEFKRQTPRIETAPKQVLREKEMVKEVIVKVRCPYCNNVYNEALDRCPYCGGKR